MSPHPTKNNTRGHFELSSYKNLFNINVFTSLHFNLVSTKRHRTGAGLIPRRYHPRWAFQWRWSALTLNSNHRSLEWSERQLIMSIKLREYCNHVHMPSECVLIYKCWLRMIVEHFLMEIFGPKLRRLSLSLRWGVQTICRRSCWSVSSSRWLHVVTAPTTASC